MKINKEFEQIFQLTEQQFLELENNCLENGILDSIKVWNDIIVDGHNRYKIATKHALLYTVEELSFKDNTEAELWIRKYQNSRRNLTPEQHALNIAAIYKLEKKDIGHNRFSSGAKNAPLQTKQKIAKEFNISERTVMNYVKAADKIEKVPIVLNEVKQGTMKLNEAVEIAEIIEEHEYIRNDKDTVIQKAKEYRQEHKTRKVKNKPLTINITKPVPLEVGIYNTLIHDIKDFETVSEVINYLEKLIKLH